MAPWFRPKNCCLRSSASFSTSFLCASSVSTLALTSDFQRKGRLHMSWIGYLVTPWPQCVSSAQFFRDRFWWINTMSSQMDQPPSKGTAPWLLLPAPVDKNTASPGGNPNGTWSPNGWCSRSMQMFTFGDMFPGNGGMIIIHPFQTGGLLGP